MTGYGATSQWENLLRHLGSWQGSFTQLSPQGEVRTDTPTLVRLEALNHHQTVRQTIQYLSPTTQAVEQEKVLEYSTLSRSVLFFENGAFSQGSMQWGPFSEFGAEFGFVQGSRRLRLVQLFGTDGHLASFTLIREQLAGTQAPERPPLTVEALLGEWQGEAVTLYPDWRSPQVATTTLQLKRQGDYLQQALTSEGFSLKTQARIQGPLLQFEQGPYPAQVLLLPDGASCLSPLVVKAGKPFLLEVGWLIEDNLRQRLIRRYDNKGGWSSLTLVTERRTPQSDHPAVN